jgi:hypothetical protein
MILGSMRRLWRMLWQSFEGVHGVLCKPCLRFGTSVILSCPFSSILIPNGPLLSTALKLLSSLIYRNSPCQSRSPPRHAIVHAESNSAVHVAATERSNRHVQKNRRAAEKMSP